MINPGVQVLNNSGAGIRGDINANIRVGAYGSDASCDQSSYLSINADSVGKLKCPGADKTK